METVVPVTHDLGAFKVRRTLPAKTRTMVGPFIFVDEFGPARLPVGTGSSRLRRAREHFRARVARLVAREGGAR